ncbi:NADP-dependent aldehyde dehydrogenase [Fodinibius roseus]|uniref:NADP-dependent aldehyde dehydrogenase n=1 Tax=Fodinibius roseus TaxID=1194090 RepID=A0A1M5FHV5_9BACT|nr:aldehyde dehydrogenase (NADP(+)) [Fodinibius roseus]SHF91064.1 NADP-dependent aldehyde dehydrogenase [Fodinibius roseus]
MEITGKHLIGKTLSSEGNTDFRAVNPATGEEIEGSFSDATAGEVDEAIQKAESAFRNYRKRPGKEQATFLEKIGEEIMALEDLLIRRCMRETGLPEGRLEGERKRTVNQLKLFAELLRDGSWVDARIDRGASAAKPDVRRMQMPLGPVGIFGASNFPLAFSVAGGDTASALAAGCSVVMKAHPAHPGTCELVGRAIMKAAKDAGMPDGVFSLIHGRSHETGQAIVRHPLIKAIGFTGSFKGGKAIYDTAVRRDEPIPVFAEMGSTNPVFLLPGALKERGGEVAEGLTNSVNLGVGQFCTKPGLVAYEDSDDARAFQQRVAEQFQTSEVGTMLTPGIHSAYQEGLEQLLRQDGVQLVTTGKEGTSHTAGQPYLLQVDAQQFLASDVLEEEVFGPSTLTITAGGKQDLIEIAESLEGHLTATLHGTEEDLKAYEDLVAVLERKVGRLIFNGYPTGVEVGHAMMHGGPFPATTDVRTTSVGTAAIRRFSRPICYQDFSQETLPAALKDHNPLDIWRLVDGDFTRGAV